MGANLVKSHTNSPDNSSLAKIMPSVAIPEGVKPLDNYL